MSRLAICLLCLIVLPAWAESGGYFDDRQRGYYFYEDPPEEKIEDPAPESEKPQPSTQVAAQSEPETHLSRLKEMGKKWEEGMALAILDPSLQNVRDWMVLHSQIINQARDFSTNVKETVWVTPELDSSIQIPRNPETILHDNRRNIENRESALKNIARNKGLLYVFRSDCPYCTRFSPLLLDFAERYGFNILSVSLDGRGTPEFPFPKMPNAFTDRLNIEVVPAVYVVDPLDNRIVPAAFGFTSLSQLEIKVEHAGRQFEELDSSLAANNR